MKTLDVQAPSHQYPIYIANNLRDILEAKMSDYATRKVMVVTNTTVKRWYLEPVKKALQATGTVVDEVVLEDGEEHKNIGSISKIWDKLMEGRFERNSLLVALGGGVVGDMAGFAASTYQRGMPFLQIPTTLLSQVDSSVGGKTGVNHPLGKNMIGAFYQPQAVFIGTDVLGTLPDRELSAGMAEVIKYGLLGDLEFANWLDANMEDLLSLDQEKLSTAIQKCCEMKAEVVKADEKESGKRALLNLGHTFAHAIETHEGYGKWLHGEAVGAGMVLAARMSRLKGNIGEDDEKMVEKLVGKAKLPTVPPKMDIETWSSLMSHDKKVKDGKIRFVLLEKVGKAYIDSDVDAMLLEETLKPFV